MEFNPITPEMILDPRCPLGENPIWHPAENRLYWVDIPSGTIYRYSPDANEMESFPTGAVIGGFTIQSDGSLLLFGAKGSIRLWREGQITTVQDQLEGETQTRFNDVIADPFGGVFCGMLSSRNHAGTLYYLTPKGEIFPVLRDVLCSNGMGFDPERHLFYHTDSDRREISRFDYLGMGMISNQQSFTKIPEGSGVPDGMTVDANGNVWSARWQGSCLVRYDLHGQIDLQITFPAFRVTSVTFGGSEYTDIFVTTAGGDKKSEDGLGAGAIFRIRLGIRGIPEYYSKIKFTEEIAPLSEK